MNFISSTDERLFVSGIAKGQNSSFEKDMNTGLTIVWNSGEDARFKVDNKEVLIEKDCVIFLTEYHRVDNFLFEELKVIQFNRGFYCVEDHDVETGCKGLLFYGASSVPKIVIPEEQQRHFNILWEVLELEMAEKDNLKIEMLRSLLKRFLILCLRVYKNQNKDILIDESRTSLIREFNYLVEKNYKTLTKVGDYSKLLHKSPKTLSNTFHKFADKTPLQIINDRRILEARRLLKYTDLPIQEIAEELNFTDTQAFSNFFKKREHRSPSQFRSELDTKA